MEWVETTGNTVAEAVAEALERLGVAESDAEIIVLEEPKTSLFGFRRKAARVRVRVRPVQAKAKRPSRRSGSSGGSGAGGASGGGSRRSGGARGSASSSGAGEGRRRHETPGSAGSNGSNHSEMQEPATSVSEGGTEESGLFGGSASAEASNQAAEPARSSRPRSRSRSRGGKPEGRGDTSAGTQSRSGHRAGIVNEEEQMSIETQAEEAVRFVQGVVEGFGLTASTTSEISEDAVRVSVDGDNVGLLIGPRGATVDALQELTRTAVQRRSEETRIRIVVDVGGYRLRRAAALQQFARRVASEVTDSGEPQALDAMSAADRKIVHDAINEIPGVRTTSEGEDPHRYVVVHPDVSRSANAGIGSGSDDELELAVDDADGPAAPDEDEHSSI